MAKHEFGIMQEPPQKVQLYDEYDPQSYNCISVDDDYLEDIVVKFNGIDFYWYTLDVPRRGLRMWESRSSQQHQYQHLIAVM